MCLEERSKREERFFQVTKEKRRLIKGDMREMMGELPNTGRIKKIKIRVP